MSPWILPSTLAALGLTAALAALQIRRRRGNRVQLRLLAGRRRLLGDEIARHLEGLAAGGSPDAARVEADGLLDHLHTGLLDRQAHLQNLEDLARLQQLKLAVLAQRREACAAGHLDFAPTPEAEPTPASPRDGSLVEQRERLQDKLLEQIQRRGAPPRPPRRRRRR